MKEFNITGVCVPQYHYMVNLNERMKKIKKMVDGNKYFVINRARQYGKTTTLYAIKEYLSDEYIVISLDFQMFGEANFIFENVFAKAFAKYFLQVLRGKKLVNSADLEETLHKLENESKQDSFLLFDLFMILSEICGKSEKPMVLIIDEIDSASNNQVFLDFLAQLRGYYLNRFQTPTFQSVILAGVYDIKNLKRKIRPEEDHKMNSPWNIAEDFNIDMSFSQEEIQGMLKEYEDDNCTGMNIESMSKLLYDYTSGYPFLVSRICKYIDEELPGTEKYDDKGKAWTKDGFLEAERRLLNESNTLFDSLSEKLNAYPEMNNLIFNTLFKGDKMQYNIYNENIAIGVMFGFLKKKDNTVAVANRIFETWLYNLYLTNEEMRKTELVQTSVAEKNQFIMNGVLNMKLIMERFVKHFYEIYADSDEKFLEENGTRFFLLYVRPIINGTGNYYIEAQTRSKKRTDVVIDYHGEQYIVEMKIWHGQEYNERGEEQLVKYLDDYGMDKGYMLSFNFNKNKTIGVKEIVVGDKMLIEAVV